MSGHSKWHNIQATKGKADAARGKIFTKIGREIAVAVKMGGADINTNSKLYDVVQKAKQNNMPNDSIQRSIKKAAGEGPNENYSPITYEGYGPYGVAFIVECLTDNKNRTASDVRHLFDKFGGNLGTDGSVSYLFEYKGVVVVAKNDLTEDDVMMVALDSGADDVQTEDEAFIVYCATDKVHDVSKAFEAAGMTVEQAEADYVPFNYMELTESQQETIGKLTDALDDLDDVQNVYNNMG